MKFNVQSAGFAGAIRSVAEALTAIDENGQIVLSVGPTTLAVSAPGRQRWAGIKLKLSAAPDPAPSPGDPAAEIRLPEAMLSRLAALIESETVAVDASGPTAVTFEAGRQRFSVPRASTEPPGMSVDWTQGFDRIDKAGMCHALRGAASACAIVGAKQAKLNRVVVHRRDDTTLSVFGGDSNTIMRWTVAGEFTQVGFRIAAADAAFLAGIDSQPPALKDAGIVKLQVAADGSVIAVGHGRCEMTVLAVEDGPDPGLCDAICPVISPEHAFHAKADDILRACAASEVYASEKRPAAVYVHPHEGRIRVAGSDWEAAFDVSGISGYVPEVIKLSSERLARCVRAAGAWSDEGDVRIGFMWRTPAFVVTEEPTEEDDFTVLFHGDGAAAACGHLVDTEPTEK